MTSQEVGWNCHFCTETCTILQVYDECILHTHAIPAAFCLRTDIHTAIMIMYECPVSPSLAPLLRWVSTGALNISKGTGSLRMESPAGDQSHVRLFLWWVKDERRWNDFENNRGGKECEECCWNGRTPRMIQVVWFHNKVAKLNYFLIV